MQFPQREEHLSLLFRVVAGLLFGCAWVGCEAPVPQEKATGVVGIWRGSIEDKPLSIEFRADGRAILMSGNEDGVHIASYTVDSSKQPAFLDLLFHRPDQPSFHTLLEFKSNNTIRIGPLEEDKPRPEALGHDPIVMTRATEHVLPRGMDSASDRDRAIAKALEDDIWFDGPRGQEMLNICEVLYRFQFEHNASGAQQGAEAYYLSVARRDPPSKLMKRFADHQPPVRPGSQFQTGQGLRFTIRSVTWIDPTHVVAEGGYYEGGLSSSGNTYHLRLEDEGWRVIRNQMNWISRSDVKGMHDAIRSSLAHPDAAVPAAALGS